MKLTFLPEALDDIERLHAFIMGIVQNPVAAEQAANAIEAGIQRLLDHPFCGVEMAGSSSTRMLYIPFGKNAYVLSYRFDEDKDTLVVLRIWHSRENRL
ncbi:MAG: type II toxin-antitoxin system RelE/ParE family toxin [Rhodospirillaceae bacterium]